jgi:hypothetical protein
MIVVQGQEVIVDLTFFDRKAQNTQFDCLLIMNYHIESYFLE